jgi:hypothetical protein
MNLDVLLLPWIVDDSNPSCGDVVSLDNSQYSDAFCGGFAFLDNRR